MLTSRAKLLFTILSIFSLFLLLLVIPIERKPSANGRRRHQLHVRSHLQQVAARHCDGTLYSDICVSTLADIPNLTSKPLPDVIAAVVNRTATYVRSSATNCSSYLRRHGYMDFRQRLALNDCLELLDQTLDDLRTAAADLTCGNNSVHVSDIQTVLSAAITNQYTCLDGFAYVNEGGVRPSIEGRLYHVSHLVSNSLAMVKKIRRRRRGREAFEGYGEVAGGFPTWVSRKDRRLLQANATSPNLVVAKDGSGNFTTIGAAVAAAPNNSATRFVIYIKAGAYFENVDVAKNKKNLMFIGDGIGKTVVKASRNVVDGWTTFRSATVGELLFAQH
ncbi:putative Pectinesterase 3 [Cocos nucifera]|uniref:Putative Pectinesterase 3 n=1 Tax=Cocos nucifera TaxID=13894 RepID=A0A8K0I6U4_COCNU|nr:putative Pectinesterase 3 [Cocos nucifera]